MMEKTINQHIDAYFSKFKNDIQLKSINLDFSEKDKMNELLEYVFEYEKHILPKEIFVKKTKAIPSQQSSQSSLISTVQEEERCVAMRKQGDRCNRKRTKGNMYCGTHCIKHIQQGCGLGQEICVSSEGNMNQCVISNNLDNVHLEVIAQEIQGIIYYVDKDLNVYNTEDIFKNLNNPKIIAKAVQLGNNVYSIPSLGL